MQKEKDDLVKFCNENLLKALLPVLDNLTRAIEHGRNAQETSPLLEGVEMPCKEFLGGLDRFGVKPVAAVGEVFDPEKTRPCLKKKATRKPTESLPLCKTGIST